MRSTDRLIAELTAGQAPIARPRLRIVGAIVAGWFAAVIALALVEGPPMAAVAHTGAAAFAVKLGYSLAIASFAAIAAMAAGRPGRTVSGEVALIALPVLILLAVALVELASADRAAWNAMLFGSDYRSCFASVSLAGLPVFAGMIWAFRVLAPTRLALAGFLVGLSSGAAGAVAFALYCHETTASFLVTAYTPAMLVPALVGTIAARPLLRW